MVLPMHRQTSYLWRANAIRAPHSSNDLRGCSKRSWQLGFGHELPRQLAETCPTTTKALGRSPSFVCSTQRPCPSSTTEGELAPGLTGTRLTPARRPVHDTASL